MTDIDYNSNDAGRAMIAAPDWGDDVGPEVERHLEFVYSRVYSAWHNDPEIHELDEEALKEIASARMDAHRILTEDEHVDIRRLEQEIRRINAGNGPEGVSTTELDVAWCRLLLNAIEEGR